MRKPIIFVVAESSMAYLMQMSALPNYGEAICEKKLYRIPSGSGSVISLFLSKFGAVPFLCTSIAEDENGNTLLRFFHGNNIRTDYVRSSTGQSTGIDFIIADRGMPYRYIKYSCANSLLDCDSVTDGLYTSGADAVFLQLSMPQKVVHTVLNECRRNGKPLYLYTGFGNIAPLPSDIKSYTNIKLLVTDEEGSKQLCGVGNFLRNTQVSTFIELAKAVPAEQYLVRMKNGTALAYNNDFREMIANSSDNRRRDAVSSFDTFFAAAAISHHLDDTSNFRQIAKFAQIVEMMTASGEGGANSCPDFDEIISYLKANNINIDL